MITITFTVFPHEVECRVVGERQVMVVTEEGAIPYRAQVSAPDRPTVVRAMEQIRGLLNLAADAYFDLTMPD